MARDYRNTVIIMDEIHSRTISPARFQQIVSGAYDPTPKRTKMGRLSTQQNIFVFYQLARLVRLAEGCKLVLVSATPLSGSLDEIVPFQYLFHLQSRGRIPLMPLSSPASAGLPERATYNDLLLESARRAQLQGSSDLTAFAMQVLEPYLRNLFSYVRRLEVRVEQRNQATFTVETQDPMTGQRGAPVEIYGIPITAPFHVQAVLRARELDRTERSRGWQLNERQAGSFVFPTVYRIQQTEGQEVDTGELIVDGYNSVAFHSLFTTVGVRYEIRNTRVNGQPSGYAQAFQQRLLELFDNRDPVRGRPLSKMTATIQTCYQRSLRGRKVFVFTNRLHGSDGAPVIGEGLKTLYGYEEYDGLQVPFLQTAGVVPVCGTAETKQIQPTFLPRLRYAILSGETTRGSRNVDRVRNIIDLFNSPQNVNGAYIQTLIATETAEESVSFSDVEAVVVFTTQSSESEFNQIVSRVLRATSHDVLLAQIRAQSGNTTSTMEVDVYRLAAYLPQDAMGSADVSMIVNQARARDYFVRRGMNIFKRLAVNCVVHKERNRAPAGRSGTAQCDYADCDYACAQVVDPERWGVLRGNYNAIYAEESVDRTLVELIRQFFTTSFSAPVGYLASMLGVGEEDISHATDAMVRDRVRLQDVWGRDVYLQRWGELIYLTSRYPTSTHSTRPEELFYTVPLVTIQSRTVEEYLSSTRRVEYLGRAAQLLNEAPSFEEIRRRLSEPDMSEEEKALLLEQAIVDYYNPPAPGQTQLRWSRQLVESTFERYWRHWREPVELIETNRRMNVGRARISINFHPDREYQVGPDTIIVHRLYSYPKGRVKANVTGSAYLNVEATKGVVRLRAFNTSRPQEGWRELESVELLVYQALYSHANNRELEAYDERTRTQGLGAWGHILHDGTFRIRDLVAEARRLQENPAAASDKKQRRLGRACVNYSDGEYRRYAYYYHLGYNTRDERDAAIAAFLPGQTFEQLARNIDKGGKLVNERHNPAKEASFVTPDMLRYYILLESRMPVKKAICAALQQRMAEYGTLLDYTVYIARPSER